MRHALAIVIASSIATVALAQPVPIKSRVESVALFKNGLAVVERVVEAPGAGEFELTDVPDPVHGTFWIESTVEVQTRIVQREIEVPATSFGGNLQEELAGKSVTIQLRDPQTQTITGRVLEIVREAQPPAFDRNYTAPSWYGGYSFAHAAGTASFPVRFLVLERDDGRIYVEASMIATLQVADAPKTVKTRRHVLVFNVGGDAAAKPATITISYLSKGMAWAPSYRVNVANSKKLAIEQQAVIKNELENLENTQLFLVSGFPNVEFGHVTSPLSPRVGLAQFFQQLSQQGGLRHISRGDVIMQNVAANYVDPNSQSDYDISAIPTGEGVDLHYQSIGRHTLAIGDSLMLSVAKGDADYERIVEWKVPDTRDAYGRIQHNHSNQAMPDNVAWDALRFKNPMPFPMTTAPAMIVDQKKFNGQSISYWTNVGESTSLPVNKALSIRTRHHEHEEAGERQIVSIGGDNFRKTVVRGELAVSNHRNQAVTLVISRAFSGELIDADASPDKSLLEDGVFSVNPRNQLRWTLTLEPGEERTLTYRYSVLVRH